jgi:hypothetical protein
MDTEINQNIIIGHIAGLTEQTKNELYKIIYRSELSKIIEIIDSDIITSKIIEDNNMGTLFAKFEYYSEKSKNQTLSQTENKSALVKAKQLEKKMFQYWKVRMEYYINKITSSSTKKILLIGYLSFFKNHKIYLNLNIIPKFFIKVNYIQHAQTIIKYNIETSKDDIIEGNFDLNYLDINFLIKKRIQLQNIYTKIGYIVMNLNSIINTIELYSQISIPDVLYYASFIKYEKKIPIICNSLNAYNKEWLALSNILTTDQNLKKFNSITVNNETNLNNLEKGVNENGPFIRMNKEQFKQLSKSGYIYEIINTENFMPSPSKYNVYKYFTVKPVKINRVLQIDNILTQFKNLKINIELN